LDDKSKKDYRDKTRINKNEPYEMKYWTKKWDISNQQLIGAITATDSTSVKKIETYLKDKGKI
jgi:hypothetical protein